ncbi:MAG: ABC transporter ATP-binding protein [Anaerolineales bacterium]
MSSQETQTALLRVENLRKYFEVKRGVFGRNAGMLRAVDDVSFEIYPGETLGMVGESGCGKSTIGKAILRAYDITDGKVIYNFDGEEHDVSQASNSQLRSQGFRRRTQMIFQDPNSSLDPRMTVLDLISEPLIANRDMSGDEIKERVAYLMERVGLDRRYAKRFPHAFSGGQRQRISIARALSTNPSFIVADEPTSALDVSIQAQTLNLMVELQNEFKLTYLFISHNLGVIRHVSDRVAVAYLGHIVELAANEDLFERPRHPYTEALLKSIPLADPTIESGLEAAPGELGNPLDPPPGCTFHPRCQYASDVCRQEVPQLNLFHENGQPNSHAHYVACHHAEEVHLDGIAKREIQS